MISQPAPYTDKVWGVGLNINKEVEDMDGVYVVEMKHEEVEKLLLEEMKKCSSSDIPMYLRNLELLKRLKDEDGIAIRLDSLLLIRNNELRREVRERIADRVVSMKQSLEELKNIIVSDSTVDVSEAEVNSDILRIYEDIAERNKLYIRIV